MGETGKEAQGYYLVVSKCAMRGCKGGDDGGEGAWGRHCSRWPEIANKGQNWTCIHTHTQSHMLLHPAIHTHSCKYQHNVLMSHM